MGTNWNDENENNWKNKFIIAWRLRVPDDLTWGMTRSTKELAGADVGSSMTKGLVVKASVELLISVD